MRLIEVYAMMVFIIDILKEGLVDDMSVHGLGLVYVVEDIEEDGAQGCADSVEGGGAGGRGCGEGV
jgi:hypothetical protein